MRVRRAVFVPQVIHRKESLLNNRDATLVWRRSQRCDNNQCVEVADVATGVALRDSTLPDGPILRFSSDDWAGFLSDLQAGRRQRR
jgi:Domain of unknown function (DUF397)